MKPDAQRLGRDLAHPWSWLCHDVILAMVECFFNNDFSVDTTARELGVHSNTIRQRLGRFEETTGRSLHEAEVLVEVWWALQRRHLI
jgi:DNA-binding PucR family transcriptional regulator